MTGGPEPDGSYDLVGVGIGPFNLALAALADATPELRTLFLEARPEFSWHPGMLLEDAQLQVPFLADLVTLVDPTSRWNFLNYLREHDRLFPFYFAERFHVPRREYDDYCRWVSQGLPSCAFGTRVTGLRWDAARAEFAVTFDHGGERSTVHTRNVVLGVGTEPTVPAAFGDLPVGDPGGPVVHSADYLDRRAELLRAPDVTVVGSGQSGAEVFLDLVRSRGESPAVRWLSRSPAFAPMEYSKLGLEHFTPDYTAYFRSLPRATRERLVPSQWQLYKAISADTIAEIHDVLYRLGIGGRWPDVTLMPNVEVTAARHDPVLGVELDCRHLQQDRRFDVHTDMVVLATGYAPRRPALLEPVRELIDWDPDGRYRVDENYRVSLVDPAGPHAGIYVQNAEAHTHGVGAPDLGLGAHRAAIILNAVARRQAYRLPGRAAYTTFGVPAPDPQSRPAEEALRADARTR